MKRSAALALFVAGCASTAVPPARPREQSAITPVVTDESQRGVQEAESAPRGLQRAPSAAEARAIDALEAAAQRVRGLRRILPIRAEVCDERTISVQMRADLDRDELERNQRFAVALGLVPETFDLEASMLDLLGEQVVGFYDPKDRRLVVRDDIMAALGSQRQRDLETRSVIVHELVHALQDQHFNLRDALEAERNSDAQYAFRALVEGDATLAMVGYALEDSGVALDAVTSRAGLLSQIFDAASAGSVTNESALSRVPPLLRVALVAPYNHGFGFAVALHASGGFAALDRAFQHPPTSMEQVIHPEKYLAGERPFEVVLPAFEALTAAGYTRIDEEVVGELELGVFLAHGTSRDTDREAASGWGGDRITLYAHPDARTAVVWKIVWDTERDAREAEHAARRVHDLMPEHLRAGSRVERTGDTLVILRAIPQPLQSAVLRTTFRSPVGR